jgi:pimeloyl-ACP methyl ester carboxylesterase
MGMVRVNGVGLHYERGGTGEPLVLVHGSWGGCDNWRSVVSPLAEHFDVLTYDRRGHSRSERPPGAGTRREDAADLAGLIEHFGLGPAHIAGNSFGASIVLALSVERPELFRTLLAHEPPLFALLGDDPEWQPALAALQANVERIGRKIDGGDAEGAARQFVEEVAFGPGAWDTLPPPARQAFVFNAPTFADEGKDPEWNRLDLDAVGGFPHPAVFTHGDQSPPYFPAVVHKLGAANTRAEVRLIEGAGHVPQLSHPERYVELVKSVCAGEAAAA